MKYIGIISLAAVLVIVPSLASAHETQIFEINGTPYQFVIGSLNEPIVVDDKTGVDLRVSMPGHEGMESNDHHAEGGAVSGLEETLKVELIAGDKKKTLDLSPVYNTPGAYKAPFYPTVATTYSYRVFGTMNGTPVDLTFSCNPAGHATAEEDTTRVELGDGVTRIKKTGAFSCPQPKEAFGFPEESVEILKLKENSGGGMAGVALGGAALLLAAYAAFRRK